MIGYCRIYVQHYGMIVRPLTNMTKKGSFVWTEEENKAFKELKAAMKTTPVLSMSDFEKRFEVHTNANNYGIGIVLMQNGQRLAYLSEALEIKKFEWSVHVK